MPQFLLSDIELNSIASYLSITPYIYYPVSIAFRSDLFNTGARPKELLTIEKWTYISPLQIELIPLKGNATRYFIESELSENLVFAIINQTEPYQSLSLRQLISITKKILPVDRIETIEKSAIDYLFRYNKVRTLAAAGKTDIQIQEVFGWSTPLMSAAYRSAPIFRTSDFFFDFPYVIINYNGDLLFDQDTSFILYTP